MKKLFLKITILVVLFFIPKMVFGTVVINEVAWMGTTGNQYGEWIELYNNGIEEVDLNNWKLYKDGGSTLIFTLTKKIAPDGYLVTERTTDSSPDPLPTINDESGKFGGGGLINLPKGDHIVLKDSTGTTIEDLDFSSGWPNGNNTTKQTMEKITTGWQTSLNPGGTPKAQNSTGAIEESATPSEDSETEQETGQQNPISFNPPVADAGNDIIGFVNQEIKFDGTKSTDADNDELHYEWNMGDGKLIEKPSFTYKYLYPGTYLVTLMVYDGQYYVTDTITVKIQTGQITINEFLPSPEGTDEENEWIEIYNDSDEIVDISNWQLDDATSGSAAFTFPENTLIAPKSYLVFSRQITGIALNNDKDSVRLLLPEGVVFQEINYEKPIIGKSSARTAEGFVWATPTPGVPNIVNISMISDSASKNFVYQQSIKPETTKESLEDYVINYQNSTKPEIEGGYVNKPDETVAATTTNNQTASIKPLSSERNPLNLILLIIAITFGAAFVGLLLIKLRRKNPINP